jgi:branched-chain amino acid transport system substrate-binding protein
MRSPARFAIPVLSLVASLSLAACGGGDGGGAGGEARGGAPEAPKGGTLTLGAGLPLSGPNASVGQEAADAVALAVEDWAPRFAEKGWTLQFRKEDDASDPKQAMSAAYALTGEPSLFGVVGHYNSGCFLPATKVYASAGVMAITPSATNVEITRQGLPQIARVTPHDGVQGEISAVFVKDWLQKSRVAVIHDKTQYGQGLAEVFRDHGQKIGIEILSFDGIQVGEKDFKALLTKIRESKPDAVYFGGLYDEAGFVVKQMRELGMDAGFVSDDGVFGQDFYDVGGKSTEGAIVSFPGLPLDRMEAAQEFLRRFEGKYSRKVQNYGPYSFDAANILLTAAMKAIDEGKGTDIRPAVVANTRAIEHHGALGVTKFDERGDTLNQQYSFYKAKGDGTWDYLATGTQGKGIEVLGNETIPAEPAPAGGAAGGAGEAGASGDASGAAASGAASGGASGAAAAAPSEGGATAQ